MNSTEACAILYARVRPAEIADLTWVLEGCEHLALVSTLDRDAGLVRLHATPDTRGEVLELLRRLPFAVEILDNFSEE